jgi:ribosome-associated translation inhibitor RaiA
MQVPLEISFHGLDKSDALEADVRRHATKLEEFSDRVTSCRVVLEKPHRHHRRGNSYHVKIQVAVPRRELVVDREPEANREHDDPYVTVRDAFKAMRRQLQDYVREVRGDVKTHSRDDIVNFVPAPAHGVIEAAEKATSPPIPPRLPSETAIRELAYARWEAAGRPEGDGVYFWLEAERELIVPARATSTR